MKKSLFFIFIIYLTTTQFQKTATASLGKDQQYTVERANEYIAANKGSVNQTYREKYHAAAPIGWINDPNGFSFFKGEYHLFYQYYPYDSKWNTMHWGHVKSKDLVHWEDLPVALAPDQPYDKDGVFSGSAIEKDDKLYVIYTCVSGDKQLQCVAYSEDGITFTKEPQNPVINASVLPPNAKPGDFRDPKVFKRDDTFYLVTGSKTVNNTGQILLFHSEDFINWSFKSILLEGTPEQGNMFECPDLFNIDGKDIVLTSPIEMPAQGDNYQNYDSVIQFVGTIDWDKGTLQVEEIKELDHGLDFYATQTMLDDKNRRVVIAWMNMWQRNYPTNDLGHKWAGAMTLPRILSLKNNVLVQEVPPEITATFTDTIDLKNVTIENEMKKFEGVEGDVASLTVMADLGGAEEFEVHVRTNTDMSEKTVISYNKSSGKLKLDRSQSGIPIKGAEKPPLSAREVSVALNDNKLKLQVLLDVSSVEVFANDGVESLTSTVYPIHDSKQIHFKAQGKVTIVDLSFSLIKL